MGIGAALVAGAIGLFFGLAQTFAAKALGLQEEPGVSASPSPSARPTGYPLKVTKVTRIPRRNDDTWISKSAVNAATLARINRDVRAAGGLDGEGADDVMRRAGAVESTMSTVEIELEGNRPGTVRITNVRAVAECVKPLNGTIFYGHSQGESDTVKLGFELDDPAPVARYVKSDPQDGPPFFVGDYFADHKYTLKRYDQVTLRLSARTFAGYCEYRYKLELIVDGKPDSQIVDDNRRPFRVSAEMRKGAYRSSVLDCAAYSRLYVKDAYVKGPDGSPEIQPWLDRKDAQSVCA